MTRPQSAILPLRERLAVSCGSKVLRPLLSPGLMLTAGSVLLAVLVMGRFWRDPAQRTALLHPTEPAEVQWLLAHGAEVITQGVHPFHTHLLGMPDGLNLMGLGPLLGLTIPLAPVTLLFGPAAASLIMVMLSLVATTLAWYFVLSQYVVESRFAAMAGAALCGFGPALIAHAAIRPGLVAQFLVPLIVWGVIRLREPGRVVRRGVTLGLLVTWQAFISQEVLAYTLATTAAFCALYAIQRRPDVRAFLTGLGIATATALALLAYPLSVQFSAPSPQGRSIPGGVAAFSFLTYSSESVAGNRGANTGLAPNLSEESTFLGLTLVALLIALIVWQWRDVVIRTLGVLALGSGVLAVLASARFGLVVTALAGVLIAVGAQRAFAAAKTAPMLAGLTVVALAMSMIPLTPTPLRALPRPVPDFITSGQWKAFVAQGESLVPVPVPGAADADSLRWAASQGLGFAMPADYLTAPGSSRPTAALLERVARTGETVAADDGMRAQLRADVAHWRAAILVLPVRRENAVALRATLDSLIGPGQLIGDVWVWDVR